MDEFIKYYRFRVLRNHIKISVSMKCFVSHYLIAVRSNPQLDYFLDVYTDIARFQSDLTQFHSRKSISFEVFLHRISNSTRIGFIRFNSHRTERLSVITCSVCFWDVSSIASEYQ